MTTTDDEVPLSEVLSTILSDEDFCDITLQGTDGVQVAANRTVLSVRSKVFRQMLMGGFREAASPVIKLGYEGRILKAVVEYVHKGTAKLLQGNNHKKGSKKRKHGTTEDTDQMIPTLISLESAATYYNLSGLSLKVNAYLTGIVQETPSVCFAMMEACQGPTVPEELTNLALNCIRKKGRDHVTEANVEALSLGVLKDILQDDQMEMAELDFFNLIRLWVEGDPSERKATGKRLVGTHIDLVKIDPMELSTTVAHSGLVNAVQLAEAYKAQALSSRELKIETYESLRYEPRENRYDPESQILVEGAGEPAVNGVYLYDGEWEGAHKYTMKGNFEGESCSFSIFQCVMINGYLRWYISIVGDQPGTDEDVDFYSAPFPEEDCTEYPPRGTWKRRDKGVDPPPQIIYKEDD